MLCTNNSNGNTTPERRDPVPHRGFNAKAREVLLDSEKSRYWEFLSRSVHKAERAKMCPPDTFRRCGSDEEFLRRIRFGRTESDGGDSSGSRGSVSGENKIKGITNVEEHNEQFDGIDDLPKLETKLQKLKNRTLQEIGKSLSAYDLNINGKRQNK
ncbi:hypothetical protein ACQ4LE_007269 [Meloidogyne hapla]|uniref:Uncharacterized protein n=1 Tax=Meloidogyne hapla TaxID=6305 RepID=A0A1I8C2D9_MELHA